MPTRGGAVFAPRFARPDSFIARPCRFQVLVALRYPGCSRKRPKAGCGVGAKIAPAPNHASEAISGKRPNSQVYLPPKRRDLSACFADKFQDVLRCRRDVGARPKDSLYPGLFQEIVILLGDNPTTDHDNFAGILGF